MKKFFLFFALAAMFVVGCQDNNPVQLPDSEKNLSKAEPNWIALPEPIDKSLKKSYSGSEWIDVDEGGVVATKAGYITYSWWWWSKRNTKVTAEASLYFPEDAWSKGQYGDLVKVTLDIDSESATSTFDPHMEFNQDVIYNAKFTGLNLTGIDPAAINFVYQDASGSIEQISYDALNVDIEQGILEIVNARIPHFSRYGFTW